MPAMPDGKDVREGILKGLYRFQTSTKKDAKLRAQLFGSGTIMYEVLKAQEILEEKYGVGADVWSVTSYKELYRDGNDCERWNMLHPGETPHVPFVTQTLKDAPGVLVAASDYMKVLPESIAQWMPRPLVSLGHRRLRPQREPGGAARFLRSRCQTHRAGHADGAGAREADQARRAAAGSQRSGNQSGEGESGNQLEVCSSDRGSAASRRTATTLQRLMTRRILSDRIQASGTRRKY